ncbi:MAG: radical SAM protein [Proteobacteria bacterium]|nr:radical SAM protein [Pseudomonadota bacterium]MBU4297867.1 radical SAM protein [Pseudomonadota bacterium]MCG2749861.1 radical SAM protein [Desulfobulbaceae bacterium]
MSSTPGSASLLLFPPFADPTWPYVALPTLKGYLRQRGIETVVRDFNIEGLDFLLDPETMAGWRQRLTDRFQQLNRRSRLTLYEQMEYRRVSEALALDRDFGQCAAVMRDPQRFYQKKAYQRSRNCLEELFRLMGGVFFPFRFGFNQANHLTAPWDFNLLDHYIAGRLSPFDGFYRQQFGNLTPPRFIGLSLTFVSQIPETFYLGKLIKEYFPACFVMLGGPCIDQIVRNASPQTVGRIFDYADAVGMQEGEKTLEELLPLLAAGQADPAKLASIPNLVMKDPHTGTLLQGPAWTLDLQDGAPPDYADLELDRYLAPDRLLLYSPTRGCYWNKCSFCCYGFNQSGRHLYREIPVQQAVADLRALQEEFGAANFYLSCDVLAPAYAINLALGIIEAGLDIRWSTDLRIEATYTPENCRLLYQAGLRTVAFGIESGADRILRLMNKGITTELIRRINHNFHQAGIATSWMTFLQHPGETWPEATETIALINRESPMIDQFIVGDFNLTPGSLIACRPEQYGIDSIYHTAGDVFKLFPQYRMAESEGDEDALDESISALSGRYHLDHYPWAGAISTHHSFLYLLRYGQRAFAQGWRGVKNPVKKPKNALQPKFSLAEAQRREEAFMQSYLTKALQPGKGGGPAPLCYAHFLQALEHR